MTRMRNANFHLRRTLRQQGQEARRAQRTEIAARMAQLGQVAEQVAARSAEQFRQQMLANEQAIADSTGPADELDALRKQLH